MIAPDPGQLPKAFDLLHPKIQSKLYEMGWTQLRPIQADTIRAIIAGSQHLIVSAKTAGGKTEAAFLPILSKIVDEPDRGVKAMYVGPLKALINDQFRRLEDLCDRSGIPVFKWHGDVTASQKKEFLKDPKGVLLITPESIESMFVNRPNRLKDIFGRLEFIVIDEMHSFIGVERGAHLKSLIGRIQAKSSILVRLVGLSATLGDMNLAKQWLQPRNPENIGLITDAGEEKELKFRLHGYLTPRAVKQKEVSQTDLAAEESEPEEEKYNPYLLEDLYHCFKGKTALIFGNSKSKLEFYADLVQRKADANKTLHQFAIHHGSLSKAIREDTEEELKSDKPVAVFCSTTLEMGIDVGNVAIVGQVDCPWSVSSLAQRIGRSGRKEGQPSIMRMFIEELEPDDKMSLLDKLHRNFLQAFAMTELMFERWCEPPNVNRIHASTLIQQIISIIAEYGGASADKIYDLLVEKGAFSNIEKPMFVTILRGMGEGDLIEQTPEGAIILGILGEKIVRTFDFYTAFQTPDEYRVTCNGRNIGGIMAQYGLEVGSYLILAGKRWKIVAVDTEGKEVAVIHSRAGRLPQFTPSGGSDIYPKIRHKMLELLGGDKAPVYLDAVALKILSNARQIFRDANLQTNHFVQDGPHVIWFTWTGSKINRTLYALAKGFGKFNVFDEHIALQFENIEIATVQSFFSKIVSCPPSKTELADTFLLKRSEKYDHFLPSDVLNAVFAKNSLDLSGTLEFLHNNL